MNRRVFLAAAAAIAIAAPAWAQTAPPQRIRGTIAAVDAKQLTVTSREGQTLEIALADPLAVMTVKAVSLASVAPGTYIGTATRPVAGGGLQALEVLVFPEAMRGAGEGHYPWDLEPGSMMTNATVSGVVEATQGRELSLNFKGDSNKVTVPPGVPVVTLVPGERGDLKPGMKVFLAATKTPEGKLAAARVTVEKDGVAPPM